ncbi:MAG: putative GTP-binding protein EngB [Pseudomonadota bacterium]|jgi:GTP-binding protein|nr:YihA family ribosome biogenesis GTP-binding protein [Burkholderiales bacterium]MBP9768333.1 YihA family ribosome biogenesis GTP-binding protein [Burkholderiales bacterium]MDQ5948335.1 putative GTP-binding protein EngB [Pseudomonadota bacterium]
MYSEKINFKQAKFYTTVNDLASLPRINQEIAIVGRSNAGKSSLLNTLTNQTRLAYTSKTPGRTQHINYFEVKEGVHLVDLPGYGYAKVPEAIRTHWVHLLGNYLQFRKEIIGLVLIMDARHPLKDLDIQMIEFFSQNGKPLHVVLSKADKLSTQEKIRTLREVQQAIQNYGFINLSVQLFSSSKKTGVEELENKLNEWLI